MKKLFTLFLLMLLPVIAMAEGDDPVLIDGICYKLITKGNVAELVANPDSKYTGDIAIPSSVTYEGSVYSVEKICDYAFHNSTGISSVTIPSSIKSIGNTAFPYNLPSLTITDIRSWCSIVFGVVGGNPFRYTDKVYLNGEEITDLTIPDGVTSINENAFEGLKSLTSISLPESLKKIGSNVFNGCTSLKSLTLPNNLTEIGSGMAEGCSSLTNVILPASINYIPTAAFGNCKELRDVYCHSADVTRVYENAFKDSYPEYITLHVPESSIELYKADAIWGKFREIIDLDSSGSDQITGTSADAVNIGDLYFRLIGKALAAEVIADPNGSLYTGDINIPSKITYEGSVYSVEKICDYAFHNSTGISSVTIPSSIKSIGNTAFPYNLPSLTITDIRSWCSIVFGVVGGNPFRYTDKVYLNGEEITDLTIPDGVTSINENAFEGLKSLTSISLPESLKKIGSNVFNGCTSLKSLTLPNNLTEIGSGMAEGCSSLTNVILPASINYIPTAAFGNCKELRDVYCHSADVTRVYENAFKDSYPEYITLHVPEKSVDVYKADAIWGKFKEIIGFHVDEPTEVVEIVTPDGEVVKTEITIEIIDENSKTAIIRSANIPASETGCTEIAIPSNVNGYTITSIDDDAFKGMTNVTDIYLPETDQPLTLGENALKIDDEHVATIHVPVGLLGAYALNDQLTQNFAEGKVKATVTAPARYWTFSAGVDVIVPEGVGVYICKFESTDKVIITELDDSQLLVNGKRIIKANNGVLVACNNGTGGNAYDIVANPGGQTSMAPASYDAKSYGDENMLEPVLVSKNYPATNYYVLKNGEFHKILANSSKMPAGKAVLRLPGIDNGARILSIIGGPDDGTTGIRNHNAIEAESKWFDMQGSRIERPSKPGLYINNGKKVVIK